MPPKRKRVDSAVEAAPRATRTSSRLKASANTSSGVAENKKSGGKTPEEDIEVEPAAKKTKKAPTRTSTAKGAKSKGQPGTSPNEIASTSGSNGSAATASKSKSVSSKEPSRPEPYSEDRAKALFKTYEDQDTPGEIGPEGFERLCTDMDISLEGALPLVLAWQMHATEMAKFKESEWLQGTRELRASDLQTLSLVLHDLENLLLLGKPPIQSSNSSITSKKKGITGVVSEPYNRSRYCQYATDNNKAFGELYTFCFALAKPQTARNIDIDTASAFWSVLVAPKYPIAQDILQFINEKGTYKGVNKDLWNMVLEFARTVEPDLSNYEVDGAWPSMLDDFVAWKRATTKVGNGSTGREED